MKIKDGQTKTIVKIMDTNTFNGRQNTAQKIKSSR
jgi:hypothetical protein